MRPEITAVVHTRNEAPNLARCLRSLAWCDEVIVADMASEDDTPALAARLGARVLNVPEFGFAEPAYEMALAEVHTPWVVRIDADEIVTPALARRLQEVAREDAADVVTVGRINVMFGQLVKDSGWGADKDRRIAFFKLGAVAPLEEGTKVHIAPSSRPTARRLDLPAVADECILHFNYLDWNHFIAKLNRYTTLEAEHATRTGQRPSFSRLVKLVLRECASRLIRGRAMRDGTTGLGLVWMQITYHVLTYLKMYQLQKSGGVAEIKARYDEMANEVLDEDRERPAR